MNSRAQYRHSHDSLNPGRFTAPCGHTPLSVSDLCHHLVLLEQTRGRWHHAEAGLLDKGHVRFFTSRAPLEALRSASFRATCLTSKEFVSPWRWLRPGTAVMRRLTPHLFWRNLLVVARCA
jgi:hypothetical protein